MFVYNLTRMIVNGMEHKLREELKAEGAISQSTGGAPYAGKGVCGKPEEAERIKQKSQ